MCLQIADDLRDFSKYMEGIHVEADVLEKASEEGITVLSSELTAFDICGRLFAAGIGAC